MLIRRESIDDATTIREIHDLAFAADGSPPTQESRLVDQLRAAGDHVPAMTLVAERDASVLGHVMGSHARIGSAATVAIGPLGVHPDHQRRGIGSALVHATVAAADALEFGEIVLLGDPNYYHRFGFELAAPLGVEPPDPRWAPYFQLRRLATWTPDRRGAFRYAAPFDELD